MQNNQVAKMLGIKIRQERESHNMSLSQIANLIGVTEELLTQFECGDTCIDIDSLFVFARLFNLQPTYFLFGTVNVNIGASSTLH